MFARTIGLCGFKRGMLAAAAALALLTLAGPVSAADFVMKFGTATMNETQHQFIKFYKDEVEKASGGRIEVQIYPASQLGPIPAEIQGVQLGTVQGYIGPVDFFVGVDPRFGVFSAPLLFKSNENAIATVQDPAIQKTMFDMLAPKRMVGLATMNIGASDYGAKKAIMRLSDFDGKKLRINGTELERKKMAALGATGIGMPLSDVVPALDQGTIDGTISGLSVFVAFKMNDLLKVITVTNDTYIISLAVVSKPWFDTLPPDLQKVVVQAGKDTQAKTQQWNVDFTKNLVDTWTKLGGTVHTLPDDDLAKMKTLLAPVADQATKDQPAVHDMLQMVRAAVAKH
ncbi:MAG: TRAP transporter substrate-binding protein [Xanthobacteraceae bacterium]|jgi:tripartite ATP-independent transporter DctP family solute receptor